MGAPARYMFDEVFAHDVARRREPRGIAPEDHEKAVAEAREAGRAEGVAEGRRQAAQEAETHLAGTLDRIAAGVKALQNGAAAERLRLERDALALAVTVARKLAPALVARHPTAEIEALLRDCLGEIREAPHLVVRVAPALVDDMRGRLDALAVQSGFDGRVVVLGDPETAPGDGRIDWADGGIVRDSGAVAGAVDAAIDRFLNRHDTSQDEDGSDG